MRSTLRRIEVIALCDVWGGWDPANRADMPSDEAPYFASKLPSAFGRERQYCEFDTWIDHLQYRTGPPQVKHLLN